MAAVAFADNSTVPMQIRLAYAGEGGMHVSWNTYSQLSNPTVRYGVKPDALVRQASSDVSVTYKTSTTYNNHVKITGLRPNTQYYYLPQDSNETTPYSFKTSRVAGDRTPFEVAVAIDMGTMGVDGLSTTTGKGAGGALKPGELNCIQSLENFIDDYDFLWHTGDIAYADAWLKEEIGGYIPNTTIADGYKVYERLLNDYYDQMQPISSKVPYMIGVGNHEANCDNGGTTDKTKNITYTVSICMEGQTNFTGVRNHFRMPSAESGGLENFWYSFDHGMVHFIQYDTETDLGHGLIGPDEPAGGNENSGPFGIMNQQVDWLEKDLANVDRTVTPWIVVAGHRPWYASNANTSSCWACRDAFEPLFYKYGVDLVLSGHFHAYDRSAPTYQGMADPKELNNPTYPWYITNGAAGHYDGLDALTRPLRNYSRYAIENTYGWSKLIFHNDTHLTTQFIASGNGTVLDTATLYKEHDFGYDCEEEDDFEDEL